MAGLQASELAVRIKKIKLPRKNEVNMHGKMGNY